MVEDDEATKSQRIRKYTDNEINRFGLYRPFFKQKHIHNGPKGVSDVASTFHTHSPIHTAGLPSSLLPRRN